jgi:SAP domain
MPPDADTEEATYEANTVEELKEELKSRGLHTSGNKDELITRLEADDAAEAEETDDTDDTEEEEAAPSTDLVAQTTLALDVEDISTPPTTYNPLELPADPFAAQAFAEANPTAVDESKPISPQREAAATTAIQASVDKHTGMGTPVSDPRLGGDGDVPEPTLTSIYPTESIVGPPSNVLLQASGENFLVTTKIGFGVFSQGEADMGLGEVGEPKWESTTKFVDSSTLTIEITAGLFLGEDAAVPVVVGEPGGTVSDSIDFAFTSATPPETEEQPDGNS